ncbi:peptidoglycan-binding protein, partial [Nocardioides guangzhouensis]
MVAVTAVLLAACGGSDGDDEDQIRRAEAKVTAKQRAVTETEAELTEATTAFCDATTEYVVSLDRYGDVLTSTAPTVGDVREAGDDLTRPREDAVGAAEDAVEAQEKSAAARQELTVAQAELKAAKNGKPPPSPTPTESAAPLAPPATVNRVKQAESEFEAAQSGISDETPLSEASRQFNAAAVALEMSWLRLFADAGCLTNDQEKTAADAVRDYTLALQDALAITGYYDGGVDGVYGPETLAAVESLQQSHGLPVTGTV